MASNNINPLEDWESEELSEAELDLLAGGFDLPNISLDDIKKIEPPILNPSLLLSGDVSVVAKIDSSYTSYFGSNGTTASSHTLATPFNITHKFP